MSAAQIKLVKRAAVLRVAAYNSSLVSKPPDEIDWNEHARLVKAAICLSVFTAIEEFVRTRIEEVVEKFRGISVSSSGIPVAFKNALVVGAFDSLVVRVRDSKRFSIADPHAYILLQVGKISSASAPGLNPSELALSTNGSNLSWNVIEDALVAFSVANPSSVINGVASRIENGIFVAKDHFETIIALRHMIAHTSDVEVALGDVRNFVDKLVLFCASFDFVISVAAKRVFDGQFQATPPVTRNADIKLRFVEKANAGWRDILEGNTRASSRHADKSAATFASEHLARGRLEGVLIRIDSRNSLSASWSTPFFS